MKSEQIQSVVQEWVAALTFQQQALLMTGMRGPDGCPKHNFAKTIVRYLRGVVLRAAGDWNGENNNDFMWGNFSQFEHYSQAFWESHDEYPHHFIMHLLHCCQVVGYKHPDKTTADLFKEFYLLGVRSFHMFPELPGEMDKRLDDFGYIV